ncbi:MAG: hypothetical protein JWO44_1870 [Bacteroidetes bacterium]|nr:hypothetical protein [Bacteroidota bacterium]
MSVSSQAMHFREKRASELEIIARLLSKTIGGEMNTAPIYKAVSQLRDSSYIPLCNGKRDSDNWGYEVEDFIIPVETSRHVRPKGVTKLELTLNIKLVANYKEWDTLSDPLCDLCFNVVIRGVGATNYFSCFHIDRHDFSKITTEPHPVYHLQYSVNPYDDPNFDYGSVLYIDTPRIVHYPMDFVLGIGFLTSNFFPTAFELLLDDGTFTNLYKEYQERIWKPFSHSLADHWTFDKRSIVWKPSSTLCPYII